MKPGGRTRASPPLHGHLTSAAKRAQGAELALRYCAGEVAAELTSGLAAAWNQHVMRAFASVSHDDAALVNVADAYMRGR